MLVEFQLIYVSFKSDNFREIVIMKILSTKSGSFWVLERE